MADAATLAAAVQARVAGQLLIELTQPRTPGASAVDSDVLEAACTDAIARFAAATGTAFDSAQPAHTAAAVELAIALLYRRAGHLDDADRREALVQPVLAQLARRSGMTARTSSHVQIDDGARRTKHDFAPDDWTGYAPERARPDDGTD